MKNEKQIAQQIFEKLIIMRLENDAEIEIEDNSIIVSGSRQGVREVVHESILKIIPKGYMIKPESAISEGKNIIRILKN